jgi:hypothetical protein
MFSGRRVVKGSRRGLFTVGRKGQFTKMLSRVRCSGSCKGEGAWGSVTMRIEDRRPLAVEAGEERSKVRVGGHSPGTSRVIVILSGRKAATTRSETTIHKHLSNPLSDPHRVSAVSLPP